MPRQSSLKPREVNFFCIHGHTRGCAESARLLMLLQAHGWREHKRSGNTWRDPGGYCCSPNTKGATRACDTVYLIAPFEFQYQMLAITDNCTELNVGWVNLEQFPSIPYSWHSVALNGETMFYRLQCTLRDEEIDWDRRCEPLTNEEYAALLKK